MPARWAADGPKTSTLANNLELVLFRLTKSPGQLADHLVLRRGNYITCVSGGLSDHTQFCCALSWKQNTCYDLKDIRYWITRPYLLVSSHLKETHFFTLCYHFVKKTKKKIPENGGYWDVYVKISPLISDEMLVQRLTHWWLTWREASGQIPIAFVVSNEKWIFGMLKTWKETSELEKFFLHFFFNQLSIKESILN